MTRRARCFCAMMRFVTRRAIPVDGHRYRRAMTCLTIDARLNVPIVFERQRSTNCAVLDAKRHAGRNGECCRLPWAGVARSTGAVYTLRVMMTIGAVTWRANKYRPMSFTASMTGCARHRLVQSMLKRSRLDARLNQMLSYLRARHARHQDDGERGQNYFYRIRLPHNATG